MLDWRAAILLYSTMCYKLQDLQNRKKGPQSRPQNSTPEHLIDHPKVPTQKDPARNSAYVSSFHFPCQFLSST